MRFCGTPLAVASPQGPFYAQLGDNIAAARAARQGMTQARLARAVGLSRTSMVNIEAGRQPVAVHHLVQIADELGVGVMDLLPRALPVPTLTKLELPAELDDAQRAFALKILAPPGEKTE